MMNLWIPQRSEFLNHLNNYQLLKQAYFREPVCSYKSVTSPENFTRRKDEGKEMKRKNKY